MAYLEAFLPHQGAKGTKPYGIFVQATGNPKILRVEWTDMEYNSLQDKKVKFGSSVLLHIYTEALYGQELEIKLWDKDFFRDDELNISTAQSFKREVNVHKVHPKEKGKPSISDKLVKGNEGSPNIEVEKE